MLEFEIATSRRIQQMGLIAVIPDDLPVDQLLEIGDALLAAPLLVMEITWHSAEAAPAITALRERFGAHMLIGAGNISTPRVAHLAIKAGAQFIVGAGFDPNLLRQSRAADILYMPVVETSNEAQTAWRAGCQRIKFQVTALSDRAPIAQIHTLWPDLALIPIGNVNLTNIADYAHAGAMAVSLDEALLPADDWSQAAIITEARKLRAAWEAALVERQ